MASDLFLSARPPGPPYSPFEYARSLNLKIEYAPVQAEGIFVHDRERGPRILLRKPENSLTTFQWRRLNFTLAHEIGHFVIRKALEDFVPSSTLSLRSGNSEEEQLCNAFAAELLMPAQCMRKHFNRHGVNPELILRLSVAYDVSIKALLCRTRELFGRSVAGVIWKESDGNIFVDWAVPNSFQQLLLRDTGRTTVERAMRCSKSIQGRDHFLLNGKAMWWKCASKRLVGAEKVLTLMSRSTVNRGPETGCATTSSKAWPELPVQQLLLFP